MFNTVGQITLNAGGQGDTFTIAAIPTAALTINGNGGNDQITGPASATTWHLTGSDSGYLSRVSFTSIEALRGGNGVDRFVFTPGQTFAGTIDGGAGTDFLDYSSFTTNLTVNLATNVIPNAAQGVSNVEGLLGGSGNDNLTGNADNNIL